MLKKCFFLSIFFIAELSFGQDSLYRRIYDESLVDSVRTGSAIKLAYNFLESDLDSAKYYGELAEKLSIKSNDYVNLIESHLFFYRYWESINMPDSALKRAELAVQISPNSNIPSIIRSRAKAYKSIALSHMFQGFFPKATENGLISLNLYEKVNDLNGLSTINMILGHIYKNQELINEAIVYFQKAKKYGELDKNPHAVWTNVLNLGIAYTMAKDFDQAKKYLFEYIDNAESEKDSSRMMAGYNNLGYMYETMEDDLNAMVYYQKSLDLSILLKNNFWKMVALNNVASGLLKTGQYEKAIQFAEEAKKMGAEKKYYRRVEEALIVLSAAHEKLGNHKIALTYFKELKTIQDSVRNEKNTKELTKMQLTHEFEKVKMADSLQYENHRELEKLKHNKELAEEKKQRYFLYGGLFFVLVIGLLVYRNFLRKKRDHKIIQKQKNEVELQKEMIEVAHREIQDSITYARRIQSAILPSKAKIKSHFPNSFILYKPKDVVAGDFYWLSSIEKESKVLIGVADCTGHGVPGAMVSVVCNNALKRSVREYGLNRPAEILDKTREIVIQEFEIKEGELNDIKDGMDIALISLNPKKIVEDKMMKENEALQQLYSLCYSGAHNPLWIIREKASILSESDSLSNNLFQIDNEKYILQEIKADKQPIGRFAFSRPFTEHILDVRNGDRIFIFSDGFADQFGGTNADKGGKKLKAKNFKKFLLENQNCPIDELGRKLDEFFEFWKGENEQLDDVCVIGIEI